VKHRTSKLVFEPSRRRRSLWLDRQSPPSRPRLAVGLQPLSSLRTIPRWRSPRAALEVSCQPAKTYLIGTGRLPNAILSC